ncbi:MAG: hypothetical protein E7D55_02500 [Acinetobacter junii]|uniref:Uncharacterized protein n=1 Tax=Acinetobacter venetianus TaxID=52133 RepID=A0A150HN58_9GAMM|nr:hypothetical protein [Acinetobacter venetianus]KXZ66790.1 hypothetical protein AVENLUH5627_02484 [Acinetobacter venetianus]MDU2407115.1 hypothetical protein [Acinetobacter junii]
MPSWENLDVFLQLDAVGGFATTATLQFADGSERAINGIFDEPYLNAQLGEYEVDDAQPRFTCKAVDAVGVKRQDYLLFADGRKYFVMTYPQQDGTGLVVLKLEESND